MQLEDWREWPRERLAPLFDRECGRWRDDLGWDARVLFDLVDRARQDGQLPGLVAVDGDGTVAGWCYASLQEGLLFIGALHGGRADVVRTLLDELLSSPEAAYARAYRCFVYPQTAAVAAALARRRFDVEPFLYLSRSISRQPEGPRPVAARTWGLDDLPETARLMARAYAGTASARCFAPGGRLEEWAAYLAQLVRTPACGTWATAESLACLFQAAGTELGAVLIATRLSGDTAHVAQVAVDPRWRRQGVGAWLVETSAARAAAGGASRQTLLVAQANTPARELYAKMGFREVTSFLFAERPRISRVASAGPPPTPDDKRVPA